MPFSSEDRQIAFYMQPEVCHPPKKLNCQSTSPRKRHILAGRNRFNVGDDLIDAGQDVFSRLSELSLDRHRVLSAWELE